MEGAAIHLPASCALAAFLTLHVPVALLNMANARAVSSNMKAGFFLGGVVGTICLWAFIGLPLPGVVLAEAPVNPGTLPALSAGVPTLDEMAGDWKNREDLEQFPSIHNFNRQMLVNQDLASISWLASPPFSQAFYSGALKLNGKVPVAERFRWYSYQAVRLSALDGLAPSKP
jgi:hypothetical protein